MNNEWRELDSISLLRNQRRLTRRAKCDALRTRLGLGAGLLSSLASRFLRGLPTRVLLASLLWFMVVGALLYAAKRWPQRSPSV